MIELDGIPSNYWNAFKIFFETINDSKIEWVLTGSFRLFLDDKNGSLTSDIDILTDSNGIKIIEILFSDSIKTEFSFKETTKIKSSFGQLEILGVTFDVMANVFNEVDGSWLNIPELSTLEFLEFKEKKIPVLSLKEELRISKILDQKAKYSRIQKIVNSKLIKRAVLILSDLQKEDLKLLKSQLSSINASIIHRGLISSLIFFKDHDKSLVIDKLSEMLNKKLEKDKIILLSREEVLDLRKELLNNSIYLKLAIRAVLEN